MFNVGDEVKFVDPGDVPFYSQYKGMEGVVVGISAKLVTVRFKRIQTVDAFYSFRLRHINLNLENI